MARKRKAGDGTVRQRKDGRWEGRIVIGYDDNGYPKTKNVLAKTKKECVEKLQKLKEDCGGLKPEKVRPEMAFGDWLTYWYENHSKPKIRPTTQETYESRIRLHIIPEIGSIPLNKLTQNDLQQFYGRLKKSGRKRFTDKYGEGLSDRMVRMCHATCRSALEKAVQDGLIRVNPAIGCKLPPKKAREMQVLTREELQRMGDICLKHNVFVIADEIHSDLIFPGHHHTVFASLGEAYAKNCAVCHAPSKTFNLAGLSFSCIMIPDETHRQRFDAMFNRYCRANPTFFAPVAAKAAWEHGEEWLKECLAYIQGNEAFVRSFAEKTWGGKVWIAPLEGTYLLWMDLHALEPDAEKLDRRMIEEAGVALDGGTMFGQEGAGFQRINLAAPRSIIRELMERMAKAFA